MNDTPAITRPPHWWPGRTRATISAVLTALAVPLLVFTVWMAVDALATVPCHRNDHPGNGSDYCEDTTLFAAIGVVSGTITLAIGGSMITVAARLFLRPGIRGWAMFVMLALMVWLPIALVLVLKFIWIPLR